MNLLPNGSSKVTFAFGSSHERRRLGEHLKPHLGPVARGKFLLGAVAPGYSNVSVPIDVLPLVADSIDQRGLEVMQGVFNGEQPRIDFIIASKALVAINSYIARAPYL